MASTVAISTRIYNSPAFKTKGFAANTRRSSFRFSPPRNPKSAEELCIKPISLPSSTLRSRVAVKRNGVFASVSGLSSGYVEEPETRVRFQTLLRLPGCSSELSLLGIGYREKVFAIIGVKVYAAGLYADTSILDELDAYKGSSADKIQDDSSVFDTIFQGPSEKSLNIVLVRDVGGKTFWDALDEAISPRIKSPDPIDEPALSKFRGVFQGRPLKKGTNIFLTWSDKTKLLISVSSDGKPTSVDEAVESSNVASALFDVFLGKNPVSPSLKASVSKGLASALRI